MTEPIALASIVEGHGEVQALPILLRRIANEVLAGAPVQVLQPIRIPKSTLVRPGELERAVELGAAKSGPSKRLLILIDSDEDCPAELGPRLLDRARLARPDVRISVVLAKCEFESWFLAAAESISGQRGLPSDLVAPAEPESIRAAKEWLSARMGPMRGYSETTDQPALAAIFSLAAARSSDSFDKFYREAVRLTTPVNSPADAPAAPLPAPKSAPAPAPASPAPGS